jgi:catechol 2,3-dioxygenase-like lactoylglutathione lyase family enzyme
MFDHISIGVKDLDRSRCFYDVALKPLGYSKRYDCDGSLGYGGKRIALWINQVDRPVPADTGSGLHICFVAPTAAAVDGFYSAALSTGGQDNGPPGPRPGYGANYYAAFVIDPDGFRLEAHCELPG